MADLDFILQGLSTTEDHFAATHRVFSLPNVTTGIVASAFMNAAGASIIAEMLAPFSDHIKVFVGVRNNVTTLQAIQTLVSNSICPILVDTATQAFIFHPKVYMTRNADQARLIVGSANATTGGLVRNIEASLYSKLNMHDPNEANITDKILNSFEELLSRFPENVFQISPETDLDTLLTQGILIDQNNTQYRTRMRATGFTRTDIRRRMQLRTRNLPGITRTVRQNTERVQIQGAPTGIVAVRNDRLLWKSRGLTRRDLNIPTAAGTNPTGSMLFKREMKHRTLIRGAILEKLYLPMKIGHMILPWLPRTWNVASVDLTSSLKVSITGSTSCGFPIIQEQTPGRTNSTIV